MLNVGSNYISFSNYSPDYRARCGQSKTRRYGRRRRRDVPAGPAGAGVAGGGSGAPAGRAGRGQPRAGMRSLPPPGPPPAGSRAGWGCWAPRPPGRGRKRREERREPAFFPPVFANQNRRKSGTGSKPRTVARGRAQEPCASLPAPHSLFTWLYLASCSRELFSNPFTACWVGGWKLFRPKLLHSSTLGLG